MNRVYCVHQQYVNDDGIENVIELHENYITAKKNFDFLVQNCKIDFSNQEQCVIENDDEDYFYAYMIDSEGYKTSDQCSINLTIQEIIK